MKKTILFCVVFLSGIVSYGQSCSYDTNSEAGPYDANTVTWVAAGGATCPPSSTFTGDVFVDVSGGDTFVWDYDLIMTGDFDITLANNSIIQFDNDLDVTGNIPVVNSGNSDLIISAGSAIHVIAGTNGDMGDPANNNVTFTVEGSLDVDGTLSSKNGTVFGGSGTIAAGALDLGGATCDGGGCPVITADVCTGDPTFCAASVTPIVLTHFGAKSLGNAIELTWITASEENNDYFTIERSSNGINYHELTFLPGAGNSFQILEYSYIDRLPLPGVSYYRLKQTDYDGTSETFRPVVVEFYGDTDQIKIVQQVSSPHELLIYNNLDEENKAVIYDIIGKSIVEFSLIKGENNIKLNQLTKGNGIYHIRIFNAVGRVLKTEKILIY